MLDYAATVHLICDKLDIADALEKQLKDSAVVIHDGQQIKEIIGQKSVTTVVLKNDSKIPVTGVFIELGAKGVMELATHLGVQLDDQMKYVRTNKKMETNVAGVFAAGDICGPPWQMAKAVGEGCVAGIGAATYARKLNK
jgi:thioredoxin reductase (NADPH)